MRVHPLAHLGGDSAGLVNDEDVVVLKDQHVPKLSGQLIRLGGREGWRPLQAFDVAHLLLLGLEEVVCDAQYVAKGYFVSSLLGHVALFFGDRVASPCDKDVFLAHELVHVGPGHA